MRFGRDLVLGSAMACFLMLALSCAPRGQSEPSGSLTIATNFDGARAALRDTAVSYPRLKLDFVEYGKLADATLAESGRLLRELGDHASLAEARMAPRSASLRYDGIARFARDEADWFLPAAAYAWGLFYNSKALSELGLEVPRDLAELRRACAEVKAAGRIPIALGNSHGWALLAWFAELDVLRNGPEAYSRLIAGERPFDGADVRSSLGDLDSLLAAGYASPDAASRVWTDAVKSLETGDAVFMLMGSYAIAAARQPGALGFALLGEGTAAPRALLGSVSGFALSTSASKLPGLLALVDGWALSGAPGLTDDGFRVPAVKLEAVSSNAKPRTAIQAATIEALAAGARLLPLLDNELPEKTAYALREAFRSYPVRGLGSPDEIARFAKRLDAVVRAGKS